MMIQMFLLLLWLAVASAGSNASSSSCQCDNNDHDNLYEKEKHHNVMDSHPDRVYELPGWNQPLPSRWYSGYLDYEFHGQQVHTHYVLLEAEQLGDCSCDDNNKPLIYWSNGGPGASSMFGLLTELGPLLLSDDSLQTEDYAKTGIPTPIYNSHAWTRLGSVLIFDQPAPVGFSHCNDNDGRPDEELQTSSTCGGIAWTDELASENIYIALQAFYKMKFPSYKQKKLYLIGESYAGIYIPTFARRIVEDPRNSDRANEDAIKLEGFAVGDGCLGTMTSVCGDLPHGDVRAAVYWRILFIAGHHQIPLSDFHKVMKACHHSDQEGFLTFQNPELKEADEGCKAAIEKIMTELGGFLIYSLYNDCPYRNGLVASSAILRGGQNGYPCGGEIVLEEYLKLDAVKSALHVQSDFAKGDFQYTKTERDLAGFYKEMNGKLKVLVYNGDTDAMITSFAAQNWTSSLGLEETEHWRPWTIDGCRRMGRYVTQYEGMFDFLTIRGSGHMVPTEKPEASYAFLQAWINGDDYPTFNPNCTHPKQFD